MVVRTSVGQAEIQRHRIEKRWLGQRHAAGTKVLRHLELQPVGPGAEGVALQQRRIGTAVVVEGQRLQQRGIAGVERIEPHPHAGGGTAVHRVEHVGGEFAHRRSPCRRLPVGMGLQIPQKCIQFDGQRKHLLDSPPTMSTPSRKLHLTRPATTAPRARARRPARDAATPEPGNPGSTARIADSITTAIVERRLMPGTKLAEQKIADIFKVSRTLVRQALNQLSRDRLVTLEPARGARVAEPSVEEARQVFEVRNMLEAAMVRRLCAAVTQAQVAELRAHLRDEQLAVARTDVSGRTRLLADFHVVLARMLGNETLAQMLADLLSRCSLIALMYQSAHSAEHSFDEHVAIVDALERRDARAAVRLMEEHLHHVERNLQLDPRVADLGQVLRPND